MVGMLYTCPPPLDTWRQDFLSVTYIIYNTARMIRDSVHCEIAIGTNLISLIVAQQNKAQNTIPELYSYDDGKGCKDLIDSRQVQNTSLEKN